MRKTLCMTLAFVIISSFCQTAFVYAENRKSNTAICTDLQSEKEELQNKIDEATGQLEGVQSDLTENLQQVQKLDEKISESQTQLDELNSKIAKLQTSMEEVEAKLGEAQENYNKQKELLDSRLIAVYESSDTQYLDVILSSKSISEFLSNYFLVTELATYDTELLEEMQSKKDEIEKSKKQIEDAQNQLGIIKENQTKTAKVLENTKTVRENFVSKLSDQEKDIQTKIDEYNQTI